ncbi:fibroblast growth factor 1-like [Ptychodera flava]|uniref:fibroblast growth factor 1-like n=1 Tax=Ptychodera flava TaxID=63121 RepID=UPI00396A37DB
MEVYIPAIIAPAVILLLLAHCKSAEAAEIYRPPRTPTVLFADSSIFGSGDFEEAEVASMELVLPVRNIRGHSTPVYELYSRTRWTLQILPDGKVAATKAKDNEYARMQFVTTGIGIVSIKGIATGRFLAMNDKGRLYTTTLLNDDNLFRESIEDGYRVYASDHHPDEEPTTEDWYLSIDRRGRPKKSEYKCKSSSQFLPRPVNVA